MAAPSDAQPWSFDISSLMIIVGEKEEEKNRLSRRDLSQCLAAVPVVGLQNYARSYELLLEPGSITYFSPYGCKSAPLRNSQLANALMNARLLEDGMYNVYRIPRDESPLDENSKATAQWYRNARRLWTFFTWLFFGGLVVFVVLVPDTTWVSRASIGVHTAWSFVLRVVEYFNVIPAVVDEKNVTNPDGMDAIIVMGRSNSAFVLEGTRKDVKDWTGRGLRYRPEWLGIPASFWQAFTRLGSLLMLLFIFSVVPNGSTYDQVAFIILNGMAQLNVLVGQRLNSRTCLSRLQNTVTENVETRTHVYGNILRHFDTIKDKGWIEMWGQLPKTDIWEAWKEEVVKSDEDPKDIYNRIARQAGNPGLVKAES